MKSVFIFLLFFSSSLFSVDILVTSGADSGAGTLHESILNVMNTKDPSNTITFSPALTINLTTYPLRPIYLAEPSDSLSLIGNSTTIDGNNVNRGFLVERGFLSIANIACQNMLAKGGNGRGGSTAPCAGGGGMFGNSSTNEVTANSGSGGGGVNIGNNGASGNATTGGAGGGVKTNGANGGDFNAGDGSTSYSGEISGTGGFTKEGTGTLTLTGANTYSGTTTISEGTLVGNTTSLQGVLSRTVVNNATLTFDQGSDASYNGAISGTGTLIKQNTGSLEIETSFIQSALNITILNFNIEYFYWI